MMFLETSALTGENVEDAFVQCAKLILTKVETGSFTKPTIVFQSIQLFLYR